MFVGANPSIRAVLTLTFYGESVLLLLCYPLNVTLCTLNERT